MKRMGRFLALNPIQQDIQLAFDPVNHVFDALAPFVGLFRWSLFSPLPNSKPTNCDNQRGH